MTIEDTNATGTDSLDGASPLLPENPFEALRVAPGMLLGEADFEALQGHPRGKLMLHNGWLHALASSGVCPSAMTRTSRRLPSAPGWQSTAGAGSCGWSGPRAKALWAG